MMMAARKDSPSSGELAEEELEGPSSERQEAVCPRLPITLLTVCEQALAASGGHLRKQNGEFGELIWVGDICTRTLSLGVIFRSG
jgi:hypothetical protein